MKKLQILTYETKDGIRYGYQFELAPIGKKRKYYKKKGFIRKREAEAAGIEAYNAYYNTGRVPLKPNISYSDYLDIWVEKGLIGFKKESTVNNYRKWIKNKIKPSLGKYYIKDISREMLQDYIVTLYHSGMSLNSITSIMGILSKSFAYAVVNKYITYSPYIQIEIPTSIEPLIETHNSPHVFISHDKMNEIYNRFPEGKSAYIPLRLGYECGLRIGEAFALTWDCVNLKEKYILINKQIQWHNDPSRTEEEKKNSNGSSKCGNGHWYFTEPKYSSVRKIDISDDLAELLQREKDRQAEAKKKYSEFYFYYYSDKDIVNTHLSKQSHITFSTEPLKYKIDFVCREECGKYINSRIMQHVSRVVHKDILDNFDYHSLRHTHTTDLAECGFNENYIKERLGHKSIRTYKNVYEHLSDDMRKYQSQRLNELYINGKIENQFQ